MYSEDGRWWWNGRAWEPVPPLAAPPPFVQGPVPAQGPGVNPAAPGMFWFFNTPDWIGPVLLNGLILMIPIVGAMVVFGWLLETRDNVRRGQWVLPPAGFSYLGRGVPVWVAHFLYGLYLIVPISVLFIGIFAAFATNQSGAVIALLVLATVALYLVGAIGLGFLYAAIFDLADSRGIGFAAAPWNVWRAARGDSSNSWRAFGALLLGGLMVSVVSFVGVGFLILAGVYLMAIPAQANFNPSRNNP